MSISDWIAVVSAVIAFAGACIAGGGLWFTRQQWKKIQAKVAMIEDTGLATEVLPAWYTGRMMSDYWLFGLLLTNGKILVIHRINGLSDDGKWMDVEMASGNYSSLPHNHEYIYAITDERTSASVQVAQIVTAFELTAS